MIVQISLPFHGRFWAYRRRRDIHDIVMNRINVQILLCLLTNEFHISLVLFYCVIILIPYVQNILQKPLDQGQFV
jgi:hypothetical protein